MKSETTHTRNAQSNDEREVRSLYQALLNRWNERNAPDLAALFTEDANQVGFDGSQYHGRVEIGSEIGKIFANHQKATYLGIVREVRILTPEVAILRAMVGMVPPGESDINPAVNAIQMLVAIK